MKNRLLLAALALLCAVPLGAASPPGQDTVAEMARLQKLKDGLRPKGGKVVLEGAIASVSVPKDFSYLDSKDTATVLEDIWGNPKGAKYLGMIVPLGFDPFRSGSWVVILQNSEDGYVNDKDAQSIDYGDLLEKMKKATTGANEERVKKGYPAVELVGWAAPPVYDAVNHKLYWAKQVRFGGHPPDTLNYNIRMLGRSGVLVLNVVASMPQLAAVQAATPSLLRMVDFQEGHRYADFDPKTDKVATYGLAALVAGGIAAKAGLFKLLWVGLLAAKKFVIVAVLAAVGYFKKLFNRKKAESP